ncbi:DUF4238 domain-containing protein [Pseudomonas putida]|uniref:DUF4238 domain-containing protein n=1 Tax=Pseudomonas putida TaxID=303 RepID=UPI001C211428|nr:DUF4238 domain-containing protein [Pseudomonas putida]
MSSYDTAKHKQHYVWRHYLEPWSTNDQVFCLRAGKIYPANIRDVAQKRDFYRIQDLNENEIKLLHAFVEKHPQPLQKLQKDLIQLFTTPHAGQRLAQALREAHGETAPESLSELDKKIDVMINNLEEELHADIERDSQEFIEQIRAEDTSFWHESSSKTNFLQFVCTQMLRTRKIQDELMFAVNEAMPEHQSLNKIWGVLRHMFAMNVAYSLFNDTTYGLRLLLNDSKLPYITTDQPVINTHSSELERFEAPKNFEIFYPISPKKAVLIGIFKDGVDYLNAEQVKAYNDCIAKLSHEQIFSSSRLVLENYV